MNSFSIHRRTFCLFMNRRSGFSLSVFLHLPPSSTPPSFPHLSYLRSLIYSSFSLFLSFHCLVPSNGGECRTDLLRRKFPGNLSPGSSLSESSGCLACLLRHQKTRGAAQSHVFDHQLVCTWKDTFFVRLFFVHSGAPNYPSSSLCFLIHASEPHHLLCFFSH